MMIWEEEKGMHYRAHGCWFVKDDLLHIRGHRGMGAE